MSTVTNTVWLGRNCAASTNAVALNVPLSLHRAAKVDDPLRVLGDSRRGGAGRTARPAVEQGQGQERERLRRLHDERAGDPDVAAEVAGQARLVRLH